jgi:hypothetical protein
MTRHQTDLRPWLHDTIGFIIEQLELAKSPTDQLVAIDAAQGVIPLVRSRLKEDNFLAANAAFAFGPFLEADHWRRAWTEMTKESPHLFAKSAEDLIGQLNTLKTVLESPPSQ